MRKILALAALGLVGNASAGLIDCPLTFAGGVVLEDVHHVGYVLDVKNPSKRPITLRVRIDFVYKGQKIQGGFEYVNAVIPAGAKKSFKGSEPFIDKLKGVSEMKLTLKKCDF